MRFEQLEYVTAVARLGSFRRAAEELHLSQPALSETVRKLEGELGVEILDRGRGGVTSSRRSRRSTGSGSPPTTSTRTPAWSGSAP
jgi:DNA-binding transcriptional LysR family regulator